LDEKIIQTKVDGSTYNLKVLEIADQDGKVYWSLRPQTYKQANVAIACFSVESHASYHSIKKKVGLDYFSLASS